MIKVFNHNSHQHPPVSKVENSFIASAIEDKNALLLISIPIVFLLVMTMPLTGRAYWGDEIFSIMTSMSLDSMTDVFRKYENNMAFYYVILFLWMKLFGDGEIATRMLSICFSMMAVYFFFRLANKFFNKTAAFFATVLLVSHPFFLFYSVENRSYSLLLLLVIIATNVYLQILKGACIWRGVLYGLVVGATIYTHYFGILIIPVHFIALSRITLNRKIIYVFSLSIAILVFLLLPLIIFQPASGAQVDWIKVPRFNDLYSIINILFGSKYILLVFLFCVLFIITQSRDKMWAGKNFPFFHVLSLAWVFLPTTLMFLVSVFLKPAFVDRYFFWCLPGAIFLISIAIVKLPVKSNWKILIFILPIAILLGQSYQKLLPKGSGYKEVAVYLANRVEENDAVISYPFNKALHYSYYLTAIGKNKPFLESKSIANGAFLPGGGGIDPDPDFTRITDISESSKRVFIICNIAEKESDIRQNRIWLSQIEKTILKKHPVQKRVIFMPNSLDPVMVLIFE